MTRGSWTQILGFASYLLGDLGSRFVCLYLSVCFEMASYITQAGLKLTK